MSGTHAQSVSQNPQDATELLKQEIRAELKHQRLRQADLARLADLDQSTVSRLLSPRSDPKISKVLRLAEALDCHLTLENNWQGGGA